MFLIASCYIADLILGDPEWFPHPIRGIGKLINLLDKRLNRKDALWIGRIKGLILTFVVAGVSGCLAYLVITFAKKLNPLLGNLAWVYLGYITLSIKDLNLKAKAILKKLMVDTLAEARIKLSQIVGRDTQDLSEEKIIKAAIESIAESTNDGIVAPLFYLILGGPVLAIVYKAINTLDSMVGYKNDRYINFGWFPARADDAANFIPARITGFLIVASSFILREDFKGSFKIMLRDGRKHPSPNSGISEAAMAGALGIKLGGPSTYQGELEDKPYIGEDRWPIRPLLIKEALSITLLTSLLMVLAIGSQTIVLQLMVLLGVLLRWAI